MKKYENYKSSGIECIGEVPEHWITKKLKYVSKSIQTGRTPSTNNEDYFVQEDYDWFTPGDFKEDLYLTNSIRKISQTAVDDEKLNLFEPNSILLVSIGATLGKLGIVKNKCFANQQINAITFNDSFHPKYGLYFLLSITQVITKQAVASTLAILNQEKTKDLLINCPPLDEQTQIANFLDNKTAAIDQSITDKENLISLLEEEKRALINEAVTKGIDKNIRLKNSGIDWLGDIPQHWEVKKLKYVGKFVNGYAFNSSEFTSDGVRVVKISNIQHMCMDWSDESFVDYDYFDKLPNFRLSKGDLVFALTRPIISTGIKASIIDTYEKLLINQRNTALKAKENVITGWLYYLILTQGFIEEFDSLIDKTGQQPNISSEKIGNINMPLPSVQEQTQIVNYIETESDKISTKVSLIKEEMALLKEYRSALIFEAVTGKIDVRV